LAGEGSGRVRFKCVKEYDIAKLGEVWELDYYISNHNVLLKQKTERADIALMVKENVFDKHFEYLDIGMAGGEQCDT